MTFSAGSPRADLAVLGGLADDAIDLGEAALALAALEQPRRDRQRYRNLLAEMATALADQAGRGGDDSAIDQAAALAAVLAGRFRLSGEEDDDSPHYASLMQLLELRRGPPPILSLVWLHVGRRQGWSIDALAFPGAQLLRLSDRCGRRVILDPFAGGELVDAAGLRDRLKLASGNAAELEPGHYAALSNRELLLRLQTAVKLRHLRHAQLTRAAEAVEAMLLFAPGEFTLWREAGLIHLRQGDLRRAVSALEAFLARAPNSATRHRTLVLLQDLRGKLT